MIRRFGARREVGTLSEASSPLLSVDEIAELAALASHLSLPRSGREIHDHHAGDWPSASLGRGLDFEEARPYSPGDDIRDMDWRTTARLGHPFVKIYREERRPILHIVMDRGTHMRFGTRRRLKVTQAARLAVLYGFGAAEAGLAVSATFWDRPDSMLPARHGRAGVLTLVEAATAPAPPSPYDAAEGLRDDDRLQYLAAELPPGAQVLLLSDFAWLTDVHETALARLAERCDVRALRILDPVERALPDVGLVPVHDLDSNAVVWIDTANRAVRHAHETAFARRQAEIGVRLERIGASHFVVGTEEDDLISLLMSHA